AWAGTGLVWTVSGGLLGCSPVGSNSPTVEGGFSFVQLSDSHIGFGKEPNKDVKATFQRAVDKVNALPQRPALVLHTGDLTHLARPEEFDAAAEILRGIKGGEVVAVPGEHDVFTDEGKLYRERFGKGSQGSGWRSFDQGGVHFVGLVNVMDLK